MNVQFPSERSLSRVQREQIRGVLDQAIAGSAPTRFPPRIRPRLVAAIALVLVAGAAGLLAPGVGLLAALSPDESPDVALENQWRDALAKGAESDPGTTFANLSPMELNARLERAATAQGFTVDSVKLLKPAGLAPLIVIRTNDPVRVARGAPELLQSIDPHLGSDDKTGWAFEGIFLKAIDDNGTPFLVIYNHWRGDDAGGGQWARSDDLYPYPHG